MNISANKTGWWDEAFSVCTQHELLTKLFSYFASRRDLMFSAIRGEEICAYICIGNGTQPKWIEKYQHIGHLEENPTSRIPSRFSNPHYRLISSMFWVCSVFRLNKMTNKVKFNEDCWWDISENTIEIEINTFWCPFVSFSLLSCSFMDVKHPKNYNNICKYGDFRNTSK